jgi:uncharacterized protein YjiK
MASRWLLLAAFALFALACSDESDAGGTGGATEPGSGGSKGASAGSSGGGAARGGQAATGGTAGASTSGGTADGGAQNRGGSNTAGSNTAGSNTAGSSTAGSGEPGGAGGAGDSGGAASPPAGFVPFADYVPAGEPIALPGIVNASDIAWKPATDSFFLLLDRVPEFYEYGPDFGEPLRVIAIENGPVDAEALAYLGAHDGLDRFALGVEANENVVLVFDLAPDASSVDMNDAVVQTLEPAEAPAVVNKGYEGVAYAPGVNGAPDWLYACQEGEPGETPIRVLRFPYLPDGPRSSTFRDGSLEVEEPWDAVEKLGSVAGDLSSLYFDVETNTLLVLSDRGSRLLRVDPSSGELLDQLVLERSPQYEGVTLASGGRLVVVSEPNFVEIFRHP